MSSVRGSATQRKTWLALWAVYLIWGSTYYAIAKVVATMPPLLAMGIRFSLAALILGTYILATKGRGEFKIPRAEYSAALALGFITLGFGIGTVAIASAHVPTGVVSLIIAALPLWIAVFRSIGREQISQISWVGTIIGFVGVVILLQPEGIVPAKGSDRTSLTFYMLLVLIGNIGWALGTYISPRLPIPKNSLLFTAIEMAAGGVSLTIAGLVRGEQFSDLLDASPESWFWFWYLVLIGSIAAYNAYLWLVMNAPVSLTATYAYVNPIIAILLGILFLDEVITFNYALGGAVIVLGVLAVVTAETRERRAQKGSEPS